MLGPPLAPSSIGSGGGAQSGENDGRIRSLQTHCACRGGDLSEKRRGYAAANWSMPRLRASRRRNLPSMPCRRSAPSARERRQRASIDRACSRACRSRSRIWKTSRACERPMVRRSIADHVPVALRHHGRALEGNGGIPIGKSNTPEFGAGANSYQRGVRRDPQALEHGDEVRRLLRRFGGGAGRRPGLARDRFGSRRFAAHAGELLLGGGTAPSPGAGRRAGPAICPSAPCRGQRADGAQRRGLALMLDAMAGCA